MSGAQWHGVAVCLGILGAGCLVLAAAALFILAFDKGADCCDRHAFDADDTVPYLPVEEAS